MGTNQTVQGEIEQTKLVVNDQITSFDVAEAHITVIKKIS